jgi:hypothetical protein
MDIYVFSLGLGAAGLTAMAFGGLARHSSHVAHGAAHGSHGAGTPGTGSHAAGMRGAGHHATPATAGARAQHSPSVGLPGARGLGAVWQQLAWLISPRVAFGILLGMGTAGILLRHQLGEPLRGALALAAGLAFDRWLLTPIWNFTLRFASKPALTLETAVTGEAKALTAFDADGHGIVQIDLDGQLVQVLATLGNRDRALGYRVRPGEALRIEDVDPKRNRCSVSLL